MSQQLWVSETEDGQEETHHTLDSVHVPQRVIKRWIHMTDPDSDLPCSGQNSFNDYFVSYRQTSSINRIKTQNLNVSRLVLQLSLPLSPTGDAPTASEWSTILLPTKVWLKLEIWRHNVCVRCISYFTLSNSVIDVIVSRNSLKR